MTLTAQACGGTAEIEYRHAYPATINTADETVRAAEAAAAVPGVTEVLREGNPILAGEDFAFMLERNRGAYLMFLGSAPPTRAACPSHNPGYDFNDDLLPIGASYLAGLVEQELARRPRSTLIWSGGSRPRRSSEWCGC